MCIDVKYLSALVTLETGDRAKASKVRCLSLLFNIDFVDLFSACFFRFSATFLMRFIQQIAFKFVVADGALLHLLAEKPHTTRRRARTLGTMWQHGNITKCALPKSVPLYLRISCMILPCLLDFDCTKHQEPTQIAASAVTVVCNKCTTLLVACLGPKV